MGWRRKLINFFKKHDGLIGIIVFLLVIFIGISRGLIYSSRINTSSELTFGIIYKETRDNFSYKFKAENIIYEGNLNNSNNNAYLVSDTLIIQFYTENPLYHIVHSKKGSMSLSQLEKKKVEFWDAW